MPNPCPWKIVMNALQYNTTLVKLNMCHNDIQDAEAQDLLRSLQINTTLKIQGNKLDGMTDAFFLHFSTSLTLLELDLEDPSDDIKTEKLDRALSKNLSERQLLVFPVILFEMLQLTHLNLSHNQTRHSTSVIMI